MKYPFKLPKLNYKYNELEPYIDTKTMEIHHSKHHQGYVNNLNSALKSYPNLQRKTLEELLTNLNTLPNEIKTVVQNNGGGHYNHSFFWNIMTPEKNNPSEKLEKIISAGFRSLEDFKKEFTNVALKRFGSGWAWLVINNEKLEIMSTSNQDNPLSQGLKPILGIDVWEHAYYLNYQNKRGEYINNWWNVLNWEQVENNL